MNRNGRIFDFLRIETVFTTLELTLKTDLFMIIHKYWPE